MNQINREDMLELTRRMTLKRNCFDRIAGAYLDRDGFVDGTFNKNFRQLSLPDQQKNLDIAKTIPFSETNVALKEYVFSGEEKKPGSVWQLLCALRECELKNDALLDIFYEVFGEKYPASGDYAVYFFHGNYDVPRKAKDKESLWESEEVYRFLICAVCPVRGDYEPGMPVCGFMFPAFKDRGPDNGRIQVFEADPARPHREGTPARIPLLPPEDQSLKNVHAMAIFHWGGIPGAAWERMVSWKMRRVPAPREAIPAFPILPGATGSAAKPEYSGRPLGRRKSSPPQKAYRPFFAAGPYTALRSPAGAAQALAQVPAQRFHGHRGLGP